MSSTVRGLTRHSCFVFFEYWFFVCGIGCGRNRESQGIQVARPGFESGLHAQAYMGRISLSRGWQFFHVGEHEFSSHERGSAERVRGVSRVDHPGVGGHTFIEVAYLLSIVVGK